MNSLKELLEKPSKADIRLLVQQIPDAVPDMSPLEAPVSRSIWANATFRSARGTAADIAHGIDAPIRSVNKNTP